MSVYTDQGRVGLWCNTGSKAASKIGPIKALWNGLFTDAFLPPGATLAEATTIRQAGLKAQLHTQPTEHADGTYEDAASYAQRTSDAINALKVGACDLDIEVPSAILAQYFVQTISALRSTVKVSDTQFGRPTFLFRFNIAPYKGAYLPINIIQSDPNLFVVVQTYYGHMERVSESEAILDLIDHGVPREKAAVCYGVQDQHRDRLVLPTLLYEGRLVRKLASCEVFSDDLLAELQLI